MKRQKDEGSSSFTCFCQKNADEEEKLRKVAFFFSFKEILIAHKHY